MRFPASSLRLVELTYNRHDRLKCDGTGSRCRRKAITEEWRINTEPCSPNQGTWRERRGLYVFIKFAMSPEGAGVFEPRFWHRLAVQKCFQHNDAIRPVASAIGALREHILKPSDGRGMAFALRQCNRSISILTASSRNGNGADTYPGVALITCVLFAVFEALMGHTRHAILLSLQAKKLLESCDRHEHIGRKCALLD